MCQHNILVYQDTGTVCSEQESWTLRRDHWETCKSAFDVYVLRISIIYIVSLLASPLASKFTGHLDFELSCRFFGL